MLADGSFFEDSVIFQADITLSFQFYKKAFLHQETAGYCGRVVILDIGLSKEFMENTDTNNFVISDPCIRKIYKPRADFVHKGNFGKACLIAGSFGKIGAAVLATKGALRAGAGYTYVLAPQCGYEILQSQCPEAMYILGGKNTVQDFHINAEYTVGIGPGLGESQETATAFLEFLKNYNKPLVIDADALNILSTSLEFLQYIPEHSILTPHAVEFSRLFGETENSYDILEMAKVKAKELNCYILLKGRFSQIVTPQQEVYYNITGNAGMAKGGSGDVLLGMITALLAQNYSPLEALILGVWLHGKAGDAAAEMHSKESMLASDTTAYLGEVFNYLEDKKRKY